MKKLILAVLLTFSTSVFASGDTFINKGGTGIAGAHAAAYSASTLKQYNNLFNKQNQGQYQGQNQGNTQQTVFRTPRQAPSFGLASMFPTARCQATAGGAFTFPLGGGGLAASYTLRECEIRESVRLVAYTGSLGHDNGKMVQDLQCMSEIIKDTDQCLDHNIERAKLALVRAKKKAELAALEAETKQVIADTQPQPANEEEPKRMVKIKMPWNWF